MFLSQELLRKIQKHLLQPITIIFILAGCHEKLLTREDKLEQHPELKKALAFYNSPDDSLKREALLFLIDNIDHKWGLDPAVSKTFDPVQEYLHKTGDTELHPEIKDSIELLYTQRVLRSRQSHMSDITSIDAELLIENIEYAFRIWEFPWTKHLSFTTFCEYVLPYRIEDEPLSRWRKKLFLAYKPMMDSLKETGVRDPIEVVKTISHHVAQKFSFHDILIPNIELEKMDQLPAGECIQRYLLVTAIGRCFGLPIALDFVRQYARWPGNHYWTVLVDDGHQNILAFNGGEVTWEPNPFQGPKMYRKTFKNYYPESEVPIGFFQDPNNLDVTGQYPYTVNDLKITLDKKTEKQDVYLFAFGKGPELIPIARGSITDNHALFKDLSYEEEAVVMPGIIEDGKVHLLKNPVVMLTDGSTTSFDPDTTTTRKVYCTSKYPVTWPMSEFAEKIAGAKIQGANRSDFSDSVTLLTLDIPWFFKHYEISAKEYAYYRYLPKPSTSINLAELQFYFRSGEDSICTPKVDSLFSPSISPTRLNDVFDWNIRTNLNTEPDEWFAVDVRKKPAKYLCGIDILTRNDYNVIEKGHTYELFYFDGEWVSVQKKVAGDFSIEFEDVPAGALMLLRDLTEGTQERIFEYKDNQQIFW